LLFPSPPCVPATLHPSSCLLPTERLLRAFLNGSEPHAGTLRKLNEWFVQRQASDAGEVSSEAAAAALSLLVAHLPPGERTDAVQGLLGVVETLGGQSTQLPRWIARLRK
jgi:hypothetical protein